MGGFGIEWSPLLPLAVLAGLGLLSLALVAVALWRGARGLWWRALSLALLLLILANPAVLQERREAYDDEVVILVDESPSQEIGARGEETREALTWLEARLEDLPATKVRVVRTGGEAPIAAAEQGTQLFSALEEALAATPRGRLGGVFLLTDGQIEDLPENLESLGRNAPLHALITGAEGEGDRRLLVTQAPSYGIVDRPLSFALQVDDLGLEGRAGIARVTVLRDGEVVDRLTLRPGREEEASITLDRRGPSVIELEVEEGPRELTLENNRAAFIVQGVRDRLRVLLVSGEPHAGERAWRHLLKSDPSVDLVHFTILRPPEKQDGTPIDELSLIAFPTRELFEERIEDFDLIIFDRYRRRGVLPGIYFENIAEYVERGGALLEAAGASFASAQSTYRTGLGRILPGAPTGGTVEGGYRPGVTDLGRRHPVTAALPGVISDGGPSWGRWFYQIEVDERGGDTVLQGAEGRPLMILDRIDKGRVAQLLSDHIWLWARGIEGGGPQVELMRRTAHWLMKEPDLEENDLRAEVRGEELFVERRSLRGAAEAAEVRGPEGLSETLALETVEPGRAVGALPIAAPGVYRIEEGELSARAVAGPPSSRELRDPRSATARIAPLAEAAGGRVLRLEETPEPRIRKVAEGRQAHGQGWLGVTARGDYRVTGVERVSLLPAFLALISVMILAAIAWYREGR